MIKFAESGWDLIDAPAKAWLEGQVLNGLEEFAGLSPSVENLARIIWETTVPRMPAATWASVTVWESGDAWASYEEEIGR